MFKDLIISVIDYFYPPFRKFMPQETFRYLVCGGSNMALDILVFYVSLHYIYNDKVVNTFLGPVEPYNMAFITAFSVSFPTGFFLNRLIVFQESTLRGRVQLFRYFLLVLVCLCLNYLFINLFVGRFHIYPTIAKILTTIIVVTFSYLTQKKYTFKTAQS